MPIATITSVNLPAHQYPHVEVNINDNTLRRYTTIADEYGKTLCVFRSPKGPDGVKKITGLDQFVDTYGRGSVEQYGQPLLNAYTLASTNAITQYCLRVTAEDATVANLHIYARYRVREADNLAPNAGDTSAADKQVQEIVCGSVTKTFDTTVPDYAGITIYSHTGDDAYDYIRMSDAGFADTDNFYTEYRKIGALTTVSREVEDPEQPGQTITIEVKVRTLVTPSGTDEDTGIVTVDDHTHDPNMQVYFVAKSSTDLRDASKLSEMPEYYNGVKAVHDGAIVDYDPTVDDAPIEPSGETDPDAYYDTNWKEVRLMSVLALGKGSAGNTISFAITSDPNRDKSNDYKNYWIQIYEGATLIEKFAITLTSNGTVRGESKYICNVVNDDDNTGEASSVLKVDFNEAGLVELYGTYNTRVMPATITYDAFDPFFGKNKKLVADRAVPDTMDGIIGYEIVEAPTGALYDSDTEFIPNAIGGNALESGNDGAFELKTNGGSADSTEAIGKAVNKAYMEIFAGKQEVKKAHYKTINTVVVQKLVKVNNQDKIETDYVRELPAGGLDLFFDNNNNYLIHFAEATANTGSYQEIFKDVDGQPIIDENTLTQDQLENNQYVRVNKIGNTIYLPPIQTWIPGIDPVSNSVYYQYPDILTKNKTEIDFFLDANYDYATKIAICNWANKWRHEDFVVYLDAGVSDTLVSKVDGYTWVQAFDEATNGDDENKYWYFSIDAYYGRIKDPYNYKIVEVTSTYNLARHLVPHWAANGGKHIPYAGSLYAVIDSYLPMSVFPLMDEGLDSEHMDRFIEEHVNYAQVNSRGDVIRATQSTRYPVLGDAFTLSNLTELNNVHIVLDIKKDVEHVLELFTYQFNEQSDLKRFNTIVASSILPKYSAAQVKSISATFNRTSEEAEYGILHLYIEVVHKNLVKIIMVDIDVNRNTD